MPFSLLPKMTAGSLTEITPQLLRSRNIRLLMLDFDLSLIHI